MGLQRLLPSWLGEPSRYFKTQGGTAGDSKLHFICIDVIILQFAGPNEATMGAAIAAGPTNSVVIDKQGMYWMAGKVLIFRVFS